MKNIENNIIEIIKKLDKKILEKYDHYKLKISDQDALRKELNETQIKLMRLELLKEALLRNNSKKINNYNATQNNEKNKLRPNFNRLKSSNTSEIQNQIEAKESEINRIQEELRLKKESIEELSSKMGNAIKLLGKMSKKIKNNANSQKRMINNIYKRTKIKSVLNVLNTYYGNNEKPVRNSTNIIEI